MRSIRHVLVAHPYGIGDLLFVTPVLRALRLIPTVERVDLLLGSRTDEMVRSNPHVDEIFSVDKDRFHRQGGWQTFQTVRDLGGELRRRRYDLLLDYSGRGELGLLGGLFLGIPRRAGFDSKGRGRFHNIRLPLPEGFHSRHALHFFCELAERSGVPVRDRFMEVYLQDSDREFARRELEAFAGGRRFMILAAGGGESWGKDAHFKRWPVRFFAPFAERLRQHLKLDGAVLLGSAAERALGEELAERLSFPALNLVGRTGIGQAAALVERAALFVGNDGGLVHIANALHVPLIAFYGPADPQVYGPFPPSERAVAVFREDLSCRPCYRNFRYNSACIGRECLQELFPEKVLEQLSASRFFDSLRQLSCPPRS